MHRDSRARREGAAVDGAGRELDFPAHTETPRRQREIDPLEVRVEEEEERVVDDLLAAVTVRYGDSWVHWFAGRHGGDG